MKVGPRDSDNYSRNPPRDVRAILYYGPNTGLVEERAAATLEAFAVDKKDPFSFVELTEAALRGNPARLADEAGTIALTGSRRVVHLREAGDLAHDPLARALELPWDSLIVIEAGELPPRSRLRTLFEKGADLAAVACYDDDIADLTRLVTRTLESAGFRADRGVAQWIAGNLGSDRRMSRMELNKLLLYLMGKETVTQQDAEAVVGDAAAVTLDDVARAAAGGQLSQLVDKLARARFEGISPIIILASTLRYLSRLEEARTAMERGARDEEAVDALRPPVFWKHKKAFLAQLRSWNRRKIERARTELLDADLNCKTGILSAEALQFAVCERALMRVAAMGGARMPSGRR